MDYFIDDYTELAQFNEWKCVGNFSFLSCIAVLVDVFNDTLVPTILFNFLSIPLPRVFRLCGGMPKRRLDYV